MTDFKKFSVSLFVLISVTVSGWASNKPAKDNAFNWEPIMEAIIEVESCGDSKAVNGICVGAMQIAPICVQECNEILKNRGEKKRYKLADRYSVEKSKEMFRIIQSHYNPQNNVEKAIRAWNGGNRYKVKSTNRYYRKVLAAMK